MNFLSNFYSVSDHKQASVSAEQGNNFAKHVADDFNPIHDTDSKRFCVPGDLLFAIALERYGLHQSMSFRFRELIKADTALSYPEFDQSSAEFDVTCDRSKPVLGIEFSGDSSNDSEKIEQLIRNYVVFSGQNFPHILVPLMQQHHVMINPARPLVIYQSMSLSFDSLEFDKLNIELSKTELEVVGKRGNAELHFDLNDGDRKIGTGLKRLVLSGLREYQQESIDSMCEQYYASKLARSA
ncbi:MAG: hypothetical protein ACJAQ6_002541 [Arenicella sp.]|jgi:hypothetical protein